MEQIDIKQLCNNLNEIAPKLINRDLNALLRLREIIGDIDLAGIICQSEGLEVIAPIYLIKKIINDVYINLATDASFGFPTNPNNWAANLILDFSSELGYFITLVFLEKKNVDSDKEAQTHLFKAIKYFYTLIAAINAKVDDVSSIDEILFGYNTTKGSIDD